MLNAHLMNPRLVREKDALLQFEIMAWLIRRHGPPARPTVPSPLHKSSSLEDLHWDASDSRSVFDWADDSFGMIKSDCRMDDWTVTVIPAGDGVDPSSVMPTRQLASPHSHAPYIVDLHGRPVFFYDPRDCVEPGYFTARAVLRLAELRLTGFESATPLSGFTGRMAVLTAACYGRQGLALANLPRDVSAFLTSDQDLRAVPHRVVMNTLCFSTCLALRIRRQSEEMILATYGARMPKVFRRKIKQACRQIDSFEQELKLLQVMSEPAPHHATNPARFRQFA